jgi:hypothetical protein
MYAVYIRENFKEKGKKNENLKILKCNILKAFLSSSNYVLVCKMGFMKTYLSFFVVLSAIEMKYRLKNLNIIQHESSLYKSDKTPNCN